MLAQLQMLRVVGYGHKILNDEFDGTKGFALEGGIKDAVYTFSLHLRLGSTH